MSYLTRDFTKYEIRRREQRATRRRTRTFTGIEINILCHMLYVYYYDGLAKKIVIFFWVSVLAKLALENLKAFTVRACTSAFVTANPKFIRTLMAPRTCEELGFSKILKCSESSSSSAYNWSSFFPKISARISPSDIGGWVSAKSSSKNATSLTAKFLKLSS